MKIGYIILLILINIIAFIGFIYIVGSIIAYMRYNKYEPAINIAAFNDIHCGKETCFPDIIDLSFPSFNTDYDQNIAKYCIYLIQRIYKSVTDNSDYISPTNLKTQIKLNYNGKLFGVISTNNNSIIISFRGTMFYNEWLDDFSYKQVYFLKDISSDLNKSLNDINLNPSVHKGFYDLYNNMRNEIILTLTKLDPDKSKNIIITGHSLGSGIATICLIDLYYQKYSNLVSYVFASPRVGNKKFSDLFVNLNLYNIMNTLDVIPNMPAAVSPNFTDKNQPYIYYNCGKIITFEDNWQSIQNNHGLGIHLANLPK